MSVEITLIGSGHPEGAAQDRLPAFPPSDELALRSLEDMLRACDGAQVTSHPVAHLAALAEPSARQPGVLVIDMRGQEKLPSALERLTQHHPSTGVLLVLSALDRRVMHEVMRAKVGECVIDPVSQPELKEAIHRLVSQRHASSPSQVFAFLGAKGGVGTTTIAVNVATALANAGRAKTLLIDLHLGCGDAALYLGVAPKFSVLDALENVHRLDATFLRGLVAKTNAKLDLLASSNGGMHGPMELSRIRTLVECATREYQHVVLDVPPPDTTIFMIEALAPVSTITIVVNQELAAVRSAGRIATAIRERYGQGRLNVVISRYDKFADIGLDDVERVTGMAVKGLFPGSYRAALEAANKGRPLAMDNGNKLASAFIGFAHDIAGVGARKTQPESRGSIFGRLTGLKRKEPAGSPDMPAATVRSIS